MELCVQQDSPGVGSAQYTGLPSGTVPYVFRIAVSDLRTDVPQHSCVHPDVAFRDVGFLDCDDVIGVQQSLEVGDLASPTADVVSDNGSDLRIAAHSPVFWPQVGPSVVLGV